MFSDLATASANYASNPLNQYTRANNVTLPAGSYDLDGNLLSGPVGASPSNSATLVWDGENRLITATVGSTTVSYIYDGLSRRVARTVGTARTFYIYDGWNCVAEYGGSVPTSGAPTANAYPGFVHTWGIDISGTMQGAGGVGGLLASTKLTAANAGTTYYPLFDGNGNITSYIDSSRNVQAYFNYDPFGNQIDNSYSNPIGLSYAFSTKAFDTDTGLYYYGYRWYDPLTGRWPSRDPIAEVGGPAYFEAMDGYLTLSHDLRILAVDVASRSNNTLGVEFLQYIDSELLLLRNMIDLGNLDMAMNLFCFVRNDASSHYDFLGLDDKPKRNLSCDDGLSKGSARKDVEAALEDAMKNGQKKRAAALRALLKVIKRGGRLCVPFAAFIDAWEQTFGPIFPEGDESPRPSWKEEPKTCCCENEANI